MKIRPLGADLLRTDGRTDMKLIVAFRNFENAPKIASLTLYFLKGVLWFNLESSLGVHVFSCRTLLVQLPDCRNFINAPNK